MRILGDIERAFASTLYPLRLPIAILAIAIVVALTVIAWRRGWFAAARRHPARTAVVAIAALVLVLPVGWYVASPLVIRTELRETAPVVGAIDPAATTAPERTPGSDVAASPIPSATAVPAASTPTPATTPLPTPTPATTPVPTPVVRTGEFSGADDFHFGRGRAILLETAPGSHVLRFEGFSVRNGPDLYVYLSPDPAGFADGAIELGRLRATDGDFNTAIPDGVDVSGTRSVVIWCREFAVLFAVAPLGG